MIIADKIINSVTDFTPYLDKTMLIKLSTKSVAISLIQINTPNAEKSDQEAEELYEQIAHLLKQTKPHDINLIIGNFNGEVGREKVDEIVGSFALQTEMREENG